MMQARDYTLQFKPTIIPTAATAVLITLFLLLSHWQWSKSHTRRAIEGQIEQFGLSAQQASLTLPALAQAHTKLGQGISDAPVTLTGRFIPSPIILWDNRVHQRMSGYYLIGLMQHQTSSALLPINLGWHPLIEGRRDKRPTLNLPKEPVTVNGTVFVPHPDRYVLDDAVVSGTTKNDTLLVQRFDAAQLTSVIGKPIHPFLVQTESITTPIENKITNAIENTTTNTTPLIREWTKRGDIGISADKHLGYALQWLTFAIILAALYIGLNLERRPSSSLLNSTREGSVD